jgi:hypothetical protein
MEFVPEVEASQVLTVEAAIRLAQLAQKAERMALDAGMHFSSDMCCVSQIWVKWRRPEP